MKPPPFRYARPESLDEVLRLLAEGDGGARVLAGGQSLIPLLNFRLARPEVLVDIAMVDELSRLTIEDGVLRIGATVTQRAVETSGDVARHCPLLSKALPLVGHLQNRARGTVVGSIAHADPSAELPAVALVLDAAMLVRSAATERIVPADEFFLGPFTTVLEPDEMLVEVRFPAETTAHAAITEIAPRSGDFALAGVAGKLTTTDDGRIQDVALALFGVGAVPQRLPEVECLLGGGHVTPEALDEVARLTTATAGTGSEDVHADPAYRTRVAGELARRIVEEMAA
ncbi:MAG: xanthine dehydrogenase family protein subunit M [Dehalococcoidia bacterium]|nr:xanthine dehydrogenase family protein subunit M [Dehalococcoidia bacterium]